jgi:hypothetical protein
MDQRTIVDATKVEGATSGDMAKLQDVLNGTPSGAFFVVKGYVSKESEKQATNKGTGEIDESRLEVCDYFLQHGIHYDRIKDKSLVVLFDALSLDGKKKALDFSIDRVIELLEEVNRLRDSDDEEANEEAIEEVQRAYAEAIRISILITNRIEEGIEKPVSVDVSHGIWIVKGEEENPEPDTLRGIIRAKHTEGVNVEFSYDDDMGDDNTPIRLRQTATVPASIMAECFCNRKKKDRIPVMVKYSLSGEDPMLQEALMAAIIGIIAPKTVNQGYEKYAKGGYHADRDGKIILYLRDCLRVHRVVKSEGSWNFKASAPKTAVRAAVERLTPKGRYRTMTFEPMGNGKPRFQSISIAGLSLIVDAVDESMYFAPPDAVKEVVQNETAAVAAE